MRCYKWFATTAGVKVVEVVDATPDAQGRVLVRKWRAAARCWTQSARMLDAALREIPATTGGNDETPELVRVRRALRVAMGVR